MVLPCVLSSAFAFEQYSKGLWSQTVCPITMFLVHSQMQNVLKPAHGQYWHFDTHAVHKFLQGVKMTSKLAWVWLDEWRARPRVTRCLGDFRVNPGKNDHYLVKQISITWWSLGPSLGGLFRARLHVHWKKGIHAIASLDRVCTFFSKKWSWFLILDFSKNWSICVVTSREMKKKVKVHAALYRSFKGQKEKMFNNACEQANGCKISLLMLALTSGSSIRLYFYSKPSMLEVGSVRIRHNSHHFSTHSGHLVVRFAL